MGIHLFQLPNSWDTGEQGQDVYHILESTIILVELVFSPVRIFLLFVFIVKKRMSGHLTPLTLIKYEYICD